MRVHDPSTIVKDKNEYWFFSTGQGITSRHSTDLVHWEIGPRVFSTAPSWTTNAVPGHRGHFWAPEIIHLRDQFLLYYSVSKWGVKTSAIGLATNPTLDPSDARYHWTDRGVVIQSGDRDDYNTIDPCVTQDANGNLWLGFGSFWDGIKLIQLDPSTGKRIALDSPIYSLARHDLSADGHDSIEASYIYRHGRYYYLFVNWGLCCRGVNSTYNIRVGRSLNVTGPYVDRDGVEMLRDGGSLFLETNGSFIGPGHVGVFSDGAVEWLSCHYYDGRQDGASALAVRQLQWDADGWPFLAPAK